MPELPPTAPAPMLAAACRVRFGAAEQRRQGAELAVSLPVLGGSRDELILTAASAPQEAQGCMIFRTTDELAGFAVAPPGLELEGATRDLYRRAFAAVGSFRLCRVWNYVPAINAITGGLENYRRFCRGRSLAFEQHWGPEFRRQLPAASAVGTRGEPLAIAFLATRGAPRHFENPRQIPAFEYPADYGPRPPSFSRATLGAIAKKEALFISGTAAIRGHATVAPDDLAAQLPCTLENIQLIAEAAGVGPEIGGRQGWRRAFKVYLRHSDDLDGARAFLERHLFTPADTVSYLEAGICRADLRIEIEAALSR